MGRGHNWRKLFFAFVSSSEILLLDLQFGLSWCHFKHPQVVANSISPSRPTKQPNNRQNEQEHDMSLVALITEVPFWTGPMVESPTFKLPRLGRLGRHCLPAFGGQETIARCRFGTWDRIDLDIWGQWRFGKYDRSWDITLEKISWGTESSQKELVVVSLISRKRLMKCDEIHPYESALRKAC